jgi:2-polyprenyl-3-methyl-5-hydroxy-6-metoxy-1,4-benzoquinol methylase/ribosomal protein S27E
VNNNQNSTLRENEIRPDEFMQGQAQAFADDIRRLLEHKPEFVDVPCPACESEYAEKTFEKYEMNYVVCCNCGTMYVNPRPTLEVLKIYYATSRNYWYWNRYIFPASEKARRQKIFRPRAERIADICRRNKIRNATLLEVGAGFGTFCEEAQRLGLFRRVIAVEPTPDLAETCRRKGLEVIEKPVEQVRFDSERIDVVASFEVIEHLFSPRSFLLSCANILSPGGLLVITCPNVRGFEIVVLQALSSTVDVEHLNYFHPASLSHLVSRCGFETLEVLTPGKLDAELVRKKILAGELDVSSQPFLKQILVDEWERVGDSFQQFLADNMLSSHMWLVARKPS